MRGKKKKNILIYVNTNYFMQIFLFYIYDNNFFDIFT